MRKFLSDIMKVVTELNASKFKSTSLKLQFIPDNN